MRQQVVTSQAPDAESAVNEICTKLGSARQYQVILYFASAKYDFQQLSLLMKERFPDCEVMGTTSSGEISPEGFTSKTLTVSALTCPSSRVKGVIFDKAGAFPYIHRSEIEGAARSAGVSYNAKDSFALTFICAMQNGEEAVLALIHSLLGNDLQVVGGTAGDDGAFKATYVSYNGKVVADGAAILFVHTNDKFNIYRENIFRSTKKVINITDADPEKRIILSIDNMNPQKRYCEMLGLTSAELIRTLDDHPFGRVFGSHIFISSLASFNPDGTINMFSRVLPNTPVEILEVVDPISTIKNTCDRTLGFVPNPGATIMVNCLQRTTRFQKMGITNTIRDIYTQNFHTFAGFTSYGEQINRINSNQTLVTLVVGA